MSLVYRLFNLDNRCMNSNLSLTKYSSCFDDEERVFIIFRFTKLGFNIFFLFYFFFN